MIYSKKQINRASDILKNSINDKSISIDEINEAMQILSHWCFYHVQPLLRAYQLVKCYADKIGNNAIYKLNRMECKEKQHNKLKIEIQLRTKLQHSWETAT